MTEQDLIKKVAEICGLTAKKFGGEKFTQYFHGNTSVYADLFSEDPYSLSALADFVEARAWLEHKFVFDQEYNTAGLWSIYARSYDYAICFESDPWGGFTQGDPHSKNLAILKAFIEAMEVIDDA